MGVSENSGTPKSSILIGFSMFNHPFWGTPIFGNTHIYIYKKYTPFLLLKMKWLCDELSMSHDIDNGSNTSAATLLSTATSNLQENDMVNQPDQPSHPAP